MDKIIIDEDVDLDYSDLGKKVDFSVPFTLRTILNMVCFSSYIPLDTMQRMLCCPFLFEYLEEAQKQEKNPRDGMEKIEYLEVYWEGDKMTTKGITDCSSMWSFHGMGEKGYVSEDVKEHMFSDGKVDPEYRTSFAVEFSPINEIADYEIRIRKEMIFEDWDSKEEDKKYVKYPFTPDISLFELLYAIFWELSFAGSPQERDGQMVELKRRVDEIEEAKANGTLDQIMIPWETVKENLRKKFDIDLDKLDKLDKKDE